MEKMSIWGVGPKILFPGYAVLLGLYIISLVNNAYQWPPWDKKWVILLGVTLILIGFVMLRLGLIRVKKGVNENQLVTDGLFSMTRNPLYCAHILFIMPGVCFLLNHAIPFISILVTYQIFKVLIKKEETVLLEHFGEQYEEYCKNVNQFFPNPFRPYAS